MTGRRPSVLPVSLLLSAGLLLPALSQQRPPAAAPRFVDATPSAGIEYRNVCGGGPEEKGWLSETLGAGAAWLDYDGDGNLDLYVVNGSTYQRGAGKGEPNRLFRGDGKGRFTEVTRKAGVGHRGWGVGVAAGDFDNDGDPDLYVTSKAGVGNPLLSASAAFVDIDNDGDLDLYVANYMASDPAKVARVGTDKARDCMYKGFAVYCGPLGEVPLQDALYRNEGDGTFRDVTRESGVLLEEPRYGLGVVTGDFDNDGDQDIYVANDSVRNSLWRNDGKGRFEDAGLETLTAFSGDGKPQAGMGAAFGDFDADGWLDLAVTNFSHDLNTVYRNAAGKFFIDDSSFIGLGVTMMALSWGVGFVDFDLDGDEDLFVANGHVYPQVDRHDLGLSYRQTNHVFLNTRGEFREVSRAAGPGLAARRSFRAAAFGDYDNDGDVDVFVTAIDDAAQLLRNDSERRGHFLQVRLIGTRSNRDGVGTRVVVSAGGKRYMRERTGGGSYLSASDPRLHFGLGDAAVAERVEIRWPSGVTDTLRDVRADRLITVREGETAAGDR